MNEEIHSITNNGKTDKNGYENANSHFLRAFTVHIKN